MNENQNTEKEFSFICWKCKEETFYDLEDLLEDSSELLLEKYSYKSLTQKDYFINCSKCGAKNKIKLD